MNGLSIQTVRLKFTFRRRKIEKGARGAENGIMSVQAVPPVNL